MKTTWREYSEERGDFHRLCRFVIEHNADVRARSTWCLGRIVDWKYGLYGNKMSVAGFCDRNACLWFDPFDELVGFVISENGDAGIAIITMAGYRFLFEQMLDWSLQTWHDRGPRFSIEITEQQALEARVLERRGFQRASTFYTRGFDLCSELPPRRPLEPGFSIVDMATHGDVRAQRILRDDAFSGRVPTEDELQRELEFFNYSRQGPIYHAATDVCVMAPDGRYVAGCEALIDARNAEADIERVCTHSAFRGRGFARAVIQECLARLQELGIRRASITGYSPEAIGLYGSLGAADESRSFVYEVAQAT